jgi:hypothetical protein
VDALSGEAVAIDGVRISVTVPPKTVRMLELVPAS